VTPTKESGGGGALLPPTPSGSPPLRAMFYVRCLMIDFSKAFDRVSHSKLSKLELPDRAINWIISYSAGRTQVVKCSGSISLPASINTSIVQ